MQNGLPEPRKLRVAVFGLRGFPCVEGGVERHCESLYRRMGAWAEVTVYRRRPYVGRGKDREWNGIRFVDLPSTRIKGVEAFWHSWQAARHIAKWTPDVVHIHNIGPGFVAGWLRRKGIPVVLTYHSANYEHEKWGWAARKWLHHSERIALENASRVIFVNRFRMERYPDWVRKKSTFIPNGIECPLPTEGRAELERLGVEAGRYVLAVGRITPEKGFDTLIRGFLESGEAEKGWKLVIAGGVESEKRYGAALRRMAAEGDAGNSVVFAGQVLGGQLEELYANAALFVLSSKHEGFPLVLLEAMSRGLDVLASDIPATHLVPLSGGDYFPQGNAAALAEQLRKRLDGERRQRSYDLALFNWDAIAAATAGVYREAVRNAGSAEVRQKGK